MRSDATLSERSEKARVTVTRTVLVVDDEPKIRDLVRSYLEREGYQVFDTDSGNAALDIVQRVQPDLVILDLGLPDVSGEEVIRVLRGASDVPVVMLTARASEGDRVGGLHLGADDYVTKPFSPRELVARVALFCVVPADRESTAQRPTRAVAWASTRTGEK